MSPAFNLSRLAANSKTRAEVAVIVPCHNVEGCLERALDSVLAQTYTNLCFYAVDDGATDGTAKVLEKYAIRGVCVHQAHAGQAAARNRGIRMSESPYVAFLDADDEWLPTKLDRQIALLKQDPSIGLVCAACAPGKGDSIRTRVSLNTMPPMCGKLFEQMVRDCFVFTPTVVVRRQCLEKVGLFDESLVVGEDFNLWLRIAARWKIAFLPEVLAIRHSRPNSLSLSTRAEVRLLSGIACLENVKAVCLGLSFRERRALRWALAEQTYRYGSYLISSGAMTASKSKLMSALKLRPLHWRALVKLGLSFLPLEVSASFMELNEKLKFRDSARV